MKIALQVGCHLRGKEHRKNHGTVIATSHCDYFIERQSGMVKYFCIGMTLLIFVASVQTVFSEPTKIFTIQVITNKEKNNALREAKKLEAGKVSDIRVEKIGEQFVVRIGKYSKQTDGAAILQKIRQTYPESMLRTTYDMPERELYAANTSVRKSTEPKPAVEKTFGTSPIPQPAEEKAAVKSKTTQTAAEKSKLRERQQNDYASEKLKATSSSVTTPPVAQANSPQAVAVTPPPMVSAAAIQAAPATTPTAASVQQQQGVPQYSIIEKAMQSFQNHQYDQAAEMFYAITRQKNVDIPTYEITVRRLADCYFFMGEQGFAGKYIIAVEHYKAILRNYPDPKEENDLAYYRLAMCNDKLKFYYEADAAYDGLAKKYPDSKFIQEAMFGVGVMKRKIGRYAQAADRLQLYLKEYPTGKYNREARFALAESYYEMKDLKNALQMYKDIMKRSPNKADIPGDAILYMGCLQYESGSYQDAIESLSYFLSIYPPGNQTKSAYYALAASFYGCRQYRTALQLFSKVIETYPGSREATESLIALANLGILHPEIKFPAPMPGSKYVENPVANYDLVLSALPDSETTQRVLYLKARGLEKTGRFLEAFEISSDAITRYPKGPYTPETSKVLKSAFKSLVNDSFAREDYLSLADLYFKTFHKGFYDQPDDDVLMKIATALQKLSFKKEALSMLNYMDAICKDNTVRENIKKDIETMKQGETSGDKNLLSAGDRLYLEGKYQEAMKLYEGALTSSDKADKRWILYHLALCEIKVSNGDAVKKKIASLKGGGEDAFWTKVADYMSEEAAWKEKNMGLAPN
ncbi:MAG: tetratricopeptide repeat protein [Syntrophus sp. (in: bacteria)]